MLAHELRHELEHASRRLGVELARRLVGNYEPRPMGERSAERHPLLLPARELARMRPAPLPQADPLQQLVRPPVAPAGRNTGETELHADELPRGQLARERAPVVLVGVPEHLRPVARRPAGRERGDVAIRDVHGAGRRAVEAGDDAHERRLPGAARPEDDADFALLHAQGEALQRGNAALGARVDAEDLTDVDEGGHSITSTRPGAPSSGKAPRVARAIRKPAASA